MTSVKRGLEAPHRRAAHRSAPADGLKARRLGIQKAPRRLLGRTVEKLAVTAWAATTWVVAHIPSGLSRWVIGTGSQAGYLLWPTKRGWSNANFGHVAGLPRDDARVRRLALGAYREYARYLVEVMHLETQTAEEAGSKVVQADLDFIEAAWHGSKGGLIFALGHVGNNEAVAAAVAERGWPINVVADDTSFPEMFERFRRLREGWGIHVIPWRNLREIYAVLRRREMLALLIDWGYRSDGIPVRLFDGWTTLPAGPATLAAKTGSRILPVAIRRTNEGLFHVSYAPVIEVASAAPADLQRATQAVADALGDTVGAAPQQWYSFKPMWPATPEEAAELEARAAAMLADDRPRGGRAEAVGAVDYSAVPAEEVVPAATLLPELPELAEPAEA